MEIFFASLRLCGKTFSKVMHYPKKRHVPGWDTCRETWRRWRVLRAIRIAVAVTVAIRPAVVAIAVTATLTAFD
jgi:hypothetical protein